MSWLYLPESVEASLGVDTSSDGKPFATSKLIHSDNPCSRPESETDCSMMLPFGTTLKLSMESRGQEKPMSSAEGFPVSLSAPQDVISENEIPETSGRIPYASFAQYDRDSASWKTFQGCLFTDISDEYLQTWPRAGMAYDGTAYRLQPLVPHTSVIAYSYLPTPKRADFFPFTERLHRGMDVQVWMRMEKGKVCQKSGASISSSLRWCRDFMREYLRTGGELNPEWIEVLMGYPIGWSGVEPVEMDKFRQWLQLHGSIFQEEG